MSVFVNGIEGWVCPYCERALSPTITVCPYCGETHKDSSKPNFEDLNSPKYAKELKQLNS